jgi:hypothetical protein
MAAYGRGQTLGSGINPESFKQDYSGFTNAAAIQAQGMANLGAQIGQATGDYFKQQNEKKKAVKQASTQIDAALKLFPDLAPTFGEAQNRLRDDDIPLSERAAEAETIAGMINMGVSEMRNRSEMALEREKMYAGRGGGASAPNLQMSEIEEVIDGKRYKVPVIFNKQTGEMMRPDGTRVGQSSVPASSIDSALNMGGGVPRGGMNAQAAAINNALPLPDEVLFTDDTSQLPPLDTGVGEQTPSVLPSVSDDGFNPPPITPVPVGGGASARTQAVPSYAVPVDEKNVEVKALTAEQKRAMGLPDGDYVGRFVNGELTSPPTVIPPKTNNIDSARQEALDAPNIAYIQKAQDSGQKLSALNAAYKLLDSEAVKTGAFANYKTEAKRILGKDVANEEQFNSLVGNLAMEAIDMTKGAVSDREMQYFTEVLAPNISKSVEGNKKILQFKINMAKRDVKIGDKVREMFEKNASPAEIQTEVSKIMEQNPLDGTLRAKIVPESESQRIYKKHNIK